MPYINYFNSIPNTINNAIQNMMDWNRSSTEHNQELFESTHIPFNQESDLITNLDPIDHKTLCEFNARFGGLCELVCNFILMNELLDKGKKFDFLKKNLKIIHLNEIKIKTSHILDVYSTLQKIIAFVLGIYPDNIFSVSDQWKLVTKSGSDNVVNRQLFQSHLKMILNSETLKLEVFSRGLLGFQGHALLIKKHTDNKYTFFDPNTGEHRNLTLSELSDKIDEQIQLMKGNDIFVLRSKDFLKRIKC